MLLFQLLQQNFNRVKRCIMVLISYGTYINSCFEWESKKRSLISFLVWNRRACSRTQINPWWCCLCWVTSIRLNNQTQTIMKHKSSQPEPDLDPVPHNSSLYPQHWVELWIKVTCMKKKVSTQRQAWEWIIKKTKNIFQWKKTKRQQFSSWFSVFLFCLQLFVVTVWNFELYMLPLALLLLLVWNFVFSSGRETAEMVRKVWKSLSVFGACEKWKSLPAPLLLLQTMEAMFEWEDEDEDKEDKVVPP